MHENEFELDKITIQDYYFFEFETINILLQISSFTNLRIVVVLQESKVKVFTILANKVVKDQV